MSRKHELDLVNQLENQDQQLNLENSKLKKELSETKKGPEKLNVTNQNVKSLQEHFQLTLSGHYAFNDLGSSSLTSPLPTSFLAYKLATIVYDLGDIFSLNLEKCE